MVKKTFKDIRKFNAGVDEYVKKHGKEFTHDKFIHALKRVSVPYVRDAISAYQVEYRKKYYEHVQKVMIDNALTDPVTKAVMTTPKGSEYPYLFDKEGTKTVMEAEAMWDDSTAPGLLLLWDSKEFDVEDYIATEIPEDLTEEEKEVFTGFVI